jgi:uncharacterized protein YqfA (UPF0365 family)
VGNPNKVIHVDFKSGKSGKGGGKPSGPGLGSGFLVTVCAVVLIALLVAVAVVNPRLIASGFFAPTLIAVSVVVALWLRRLFIRRMVNAQYQKAMHKRSAKKEDSEEHTLH